MIRGIGVDVVKLSRASEKHEKLAKRVLTPNEYKTYLELQEERKAEFFAGRFAIKEAFYKASNNPKLGYQDLDVLVSDNGRPYVEDEKIHISLSHDGDYVIAFVVIEK